MIRALPTTPLSRTERFLTECKRSAPLLIVMALLGVFAISLGILGMHALGVAMEASQVAR